MRETQDGVSRAGSLAEVCARRGVEILYAFGSRALEAKRFLAEDAVDLSSGGSDLDLGVKPRPDALRRAEERVDLAAELEDLFGVGRVDLVLLPEADPFLAAAAVRGERLFAADSYLADEYELYVLRRAGDLEPLERERIALILGRET